MGPLALRRIRWLALVSGNPPPRTQPAHTTCKANFKNEPRTTHTVTGPPTNNVSPVVVRDRVAARRTTPIQPLIVDRTPWPTGPARTEPTCHGIPQAPATLVRLFIALSSSKAQDRYREYAVLDTTSYFVFLALASRRLFFQYVFACTLGCRLFFGLY